MRDRGGSVDWELATDLHLKQRVGRFHNHSEYASNLFFQGVKWTTWAGLKRLTRIIGKDFATVRSPLREIRLPGRVVYEPVGSRV